MNTDQSLVAKKPYDVVERARVLIDHGWSAKKLLVPRPTPTEIRDGRAT